MVTMGVAISASRHEQRGGRRRLWKLTAGAAFTLAAVLGHAESAEACSCLPPSVEASYNGSSDVVVAEVLFSFAWRDETWYVADVITTYKGCARAGELVVLSTPSSSAACGIELAPDTRYLINGHADGAIFGVPKLGVGLCDYNLEVSALTASDREFLNGRTVCCGDDCACADGSEPVACFADPCSVTPACAEAVTCVSNFCGGCNAEFYDAFGAAACEARQSCTSDADCGAGEWCRQAAPPLVEASGADGAASTDDLECVPFVGEGSSCGGFTLPWAFERCEPGLVCDAPDFIADAPGVCRSPCESSAECAEDQYCSSDGACEADGACEVSADCNLEGNVFAAPRCLGYGVCDPFAQQCGWECGDPRCADLLGFDFGPCDAVLGAGVLGGQCGTVSGCSSEPFELFESEAECRSACSAPAAECAVDTDCIVSGCSGQVCAPEPVITTCEFREEFACFQDPSVTTCGCNEGQCAWNATPELAECLAAVGAASSSAGE